MLSPKFTIFCNVEPLPAVSSLYLLAPSAPPSPSFLLALQLLVLLDEQPQKGLAETYNTNNRQLLSLTIYITSGEKLQNILEFFSISPKATLFWLFPDMPLVNLLSIQE